jgi:hypothetical protein
MIRARETNNLVPYTAKNTLDFIRAKFVKTNANTTHIAWTKILLHTRDIGQAIYQWQASFDPLIRAFEQARTKKMRKMRITTVKQLIAKQITDSEKIILSGINPNYSVDNVDKGTFVLKEFRVSRSFGLENSGKGVRNRCSCIPKQKAGSSPTNGEAKN